MNKLEKSILIVFALVGIFFILNMINTCIVSGIEKNELKQQIQDAENWANGCNYRLNKLEQQQSYKNISQSLQRAKGQVIENWEVYEDMSFKIN